MPAKCQWATEKYKKKKPILGGKECWKDKAERCGI
jgi:hypothetical protein